MSYQFFIFTFIYFRNEKSKLHESLSKSFAYLGKCCDSLRIGKNTGKTEVLKFVYSEKVTEYMNFNLNNEKSQSMVINSLQLKGQIIL